MQSFEWRPTVATLLAPGQNAPRTFHQPRQDWGVFLEFFLRAALHMAPDGSDDTAQLHHCVFEQPVLKLVAFDCILQRFSATRFLNSNIASSVSLFNVISLYPNELMNLATLSLAHGSSIHLLRTTLLIMFWCLPSCFTTLHVTDSSGIV